MTKRSRNINISNYTQVVQYLFEANKVLGEGGLYFRSAEKIASLVSADYCQIIVPTTEDGLKVVGCHGFATRLEDFSCTRGIIGKFFQEIQKSSESYKIVSDVTLENDYYCCNKSTKSEIIVAIIGADKKNVSAIINAESQDISHFKIQDVDVITGVGELMVRHACNLKYTNGLIEILNHIPDELMIIDEYHRPIFANIIKKQKLPALSTYLQKLPNNILEKFLLSEHIFDKETSQTCYQIIENNQNKCSRCVCDRAMKKNERIEGVIYKPTQREFIVELSASPLKINNGSNTLGCIETARYVSKRESVLTNFPALLGCVSENELLRSIIKILQEKLLYNRVRIYKVNEKSKTLQGIVCSNNHKIPSDKFSDFGFEIIPSLEEALLSSRKAGLVYVDTEFLTEESFGYWQVSVPRNEFFQNVDPKGLLGIQNVEEFVVVPIIAKVGLTDDQRYKRFIICIDSGENEKFQRFTSDDLQALTTLSRFSSLTLEILSKNEWRYKLAVLGETSLGLIHLFSHLGNIPTNKYKTNIPDPMRQLTSAAIEFLEKSQNEEENIILTDFLRLIALTISNKGEIPFEGQIRDWNKELKEAILKLNPDFTETNGFFSLARVIEQIPENKALICKLYAVLKDKSLINLIEWIARIVVFVKNQERVSYEIDAFRDVLSELSPAKNGELREETLTKSKSCEIAKIIRSAVDMIGKEVHSKIFYPVVSKNINIEAKRGEILLAFHALIKNAVEASEAAEGNAEVNISIEQQDNKAVIVIFNNGNYIKQSDIPKVGKEAFTSKGNKGTGLGLIFAHDWIVESNNGKIHIESEEGKGTTFTITFPLINELND